MQQDLVQRELFEQRQLCGHCLGVEVMFFSEEYCLRLWGFPGFRLMRMETATVMICVSSTVLLVFTWTMSQLCKHIFHFWEKRNLLSAWALVHINFWVFCHVRDSFLSDTSNLLFYSSKSCEQCLCWCLSSSLVCFHLGALILSFVWLQYGRGFFTNRARVCYWIVW
jgi:hypothetical protein